MGVDGKGGLVRYLMTKGKSNDGGTVYYGPQLVRKALIFESLVWILHALCDE